MYRSLVIDRLQERREIHGDKVAYLYFDYKKHLDQNPVKVVSCLLRQILCQYPSTPKPASDLFERFKNGLGLPQVCKSQYAYQAALLVFYEDAPGDV